MDGDIQDRFLFLCHINPDGPIFIYTRCFGVSFQQLRKTNCYGQSKFKEDWEW